MIPNEESRLRTRQNYYFNAIQDVDKKIDALLKQLDDLDLTKKTIVIFTSDHGDLLGSHGGLSSKGTTTYKQQNHVPLLVVHPEIKGGQSCKEVTSHIDLVPTIVAMTNKDTTPANDMMKLMKGQSLLPLLKQPINPDFTKRRGGVLFCYSQLMVHDPAFTKALYTMIESGEVARADQFKKIETFPIDWSLRVSIRSIVNERYKFSRYFSFKEFNTPKTIEELRAKNDLELYDLVSDPQEMINLAHDFERNKDLIWAMNLKLNALIEREIGKDDGSFLPLKDWINWNGVRKTMINV
jgi:arylsulfatase A-like enzyme